MVNFNWQLCFNLICNKVFIPADHSMYAWYGNYPVKEPYGYIYQLIARRKLLVCNAQQALLRSNGAPELWGDAKIRAEGELSQS